MTSEKLKPIWESTQIKKNNKSFYSLEIDNEIAFYKVEKNKLLIELNELYYSDHFFSDFLSDFISKTIIANAMDFENGIEEFILTFQGKTLNKAAI